MDDDSDFDEPVENPHLTHQIDWPESGMGVDDSTYDEGTVIAEDIPRDPHLIAQIAQQIDAGSDQGLNEELVDDSDELIVRFAKGPKNSTKSVNADPGATNNASTSSLPPGSPPRISSTHVSESLVQDIVHDDEAGMAVEIPSEDAAIEENTHHYAPNSNDGFNGNLEAHPQELVGSSSREANDLAKSLIEDLSEANNDSASDLAAALPTGISPLNNGHPIINEALLEDTQDQSNEIADVEGQDDGILGSVDADSIEQFLAPEAEMVPPTLVEDAAAVLEVAEVPNEVMEDVARMDSDPTLPAENVMMDAFIAVLDAKIANRSQPNEDATENSSSSQPIPAVMPTQAIGPPIIEEQASPASEVRIVDSISLYASGLDEENIASLPSSGELDTSALAFATAAGLDQLSILTTSLSSSAPAPNLNTLLLPNASPSARIPQEPQPQLQNDLCSSGAAPSNRHTELAQNLVIDLASTPPLPHESAGTPPLEEDPIVDTSFSSLSHAPGSSASTQRRSTHYTVESHEEPRTSRSIFRVPTTTISRSIDLELEEQQERKPVAQATQSKPASFLRPHPIIRIPSMDDLPPNVPTLPQHSHREMAAPQPSQILRTPVGNFDPRMQQGNLYASPPLNEISLNTPSRSYFSEYASPQPYELNRPPMNQFVTPIPPQQPRFQPPGSAPVVDHVSDYRNHEQYYSPYAAQQEALRRRSVGPMTQFDDGRASAASFGNGYYHRDPQGTSGADYASRGPQHRNDYDLETSSSSVGFDDSASQHSYSSRTSSQASSYASYDGSSHHHYREDRTTHAGQRHERRHGRHSYNNRRFNDGPYASPRTPHDVRVKQERPYNTSYGLPAVPSAQAPMSSSNFVSPYSVLGNSVVPSDVRLVADDTSNLDFSFAHAPLTPPSSHPQSAPPLRSKNVMVIDLDEEDYPNSQLTPQSTQTASQLNGASSSSQRTDSALTQTTALLQQPQPRTNVLIRASSWLSDKLFGGK